jgi:hypothetical protein
MRFVVDEMPWKKVFFSFPLLIIPPLLHSSTTATEVCDNPHQAAHCHIIGL